MKKSNLRKLAHALAIAGLLATVISCSDDDQPGRKRITIRPGANAQAEALAAFIEAKQGTDIYFEEGTYEFTSPLSLDNKQDVRILGAGREKTILSFQGQTTSGEGVYANQCNGLLFQDFTIRDAQGDALKAKSCSRVSFINIATVWSGTPGPDNGAYGLYPVQSTEVLIDGCYAYGASDAGIYVGQSTNAVVRNSIAEGNVAGIQIENTINADVYNNEAFDNAGGILVFDLPGLTQYGRNSRIFNNNCHDNNRTNFAPPGNIVGLIPAGTGIMLLSTRNVEIFENQISDNMFAGMILASYLMLGLPGAPGYDPLYGNAYIHDNTYSMAGTFNSTQPELASLIAMLINAFGFQQPQILIDNLTSGGLCISEAAGTTFVNLHGESLNPATLEANLDNNLSAFACAGTVLPPVQFEPYGAGL